MYLIKTVYTKTDDPKDVRVYYFGKNYKVDEELCPYIIEKGFTKLSSAKISLKSHQKLNRDEEELGHYIIRSCIIERN